ncbi:fibronectin type III domain-containing protein [bacterium]|nr:fibronectin type III domain-containing protein [bacterium]
MDADLASYEDVPGFAVERLEDSLRVVMHGTATNSDKEHVDGNIEFYNANVTDQRSDNSNDYPGNNRLENGFDGTGTSGYNAGNDEVWIDSNMSYYWLTTTTADDGYYTDWGIIEDCSEDPSVYAPWCSALLGIVVEAMNTTAEDNQVADVYPDGVINLSDLVLAQQWHGQGLNSTCYDQFENPTGDFHFQCEDPNIGWCEGLLQGVKDSINSQDGDDNYFYVFDLWPANPDGTHGEGVIDLSDVIIMSQLIGEGDQVACYAYYVPPFFMCQEEGYCGDGHVNPELKEECDGDEPASCIDDDGYDGMKTCNMPPVDKILQSTPEVPYCFWNPCQSDYFCGDGIINGNEECDDGLEGSDTCNTNCENISTPPGPCTSNCGGGGGEVTLSISDLENDVSCDLDADFSWKTSKDSLTWFVYGTQSGDYSTEIQNTPYVKDHSVLLEGLEYDTTYYYRVKAKDISDNEKESAEFSFSTPTSESCGVVEPEPEPEPEGEVLGEKKIDCSIPRPSGSKGVDADILNVFQFPDGTLIRAECDTLMSVYLVRDQKKWHIPGWKYLHDNYFGQRIFNASPADVLFYKDWAGFVLGVKTYADGTLLRGSDMKIYVIENGKKHYIGTLEELAKYVGQEIFDVSDDILAQY